MYRPLTTNRLSIAALQVLLLAMTFFVLTLPSGNKVKYDQLGLSLEVQNSIKKIVKSGRLTSGVVGIAAKRTYDSLTRNYIVKNCTVDQLNSLIAFEAPVMKAVAYEGLLRKDRAKSFEYTKMALLDTTSFFWYQSGCVGDILQVGEHLMQNVLWIYEASAPEDEEYVMERFGWSREQIAELQWILAVNREEGNRRVVAYFRPR